MLKRAIDVADVFLRPVTLLTDFLTRTHIRWQVNRAVEVVANGVIKLFHPVEFRLEIGGRARADVTRHALNTGVRCVLIRHELRRHRQMTSLAAKTYRLGVLIRLITTKRSDKQECHAAE